MNQNREVKFAVGLAVILLLVGVACYAAFPLKKPDEPVRLAMKCLAGKVLFDHKGHTKDSSCNECHHHPSDDDTMRKCSECHGKQEPKVVSAICLECHNPNENHHPKDETDPEARACKTCHQSEEEGVLPTVCADCHDPSDVEGQQKIMNFQKRSDAFHSQCEDCHNAKQIGPNKTQENPNIRCNWCHTM
ncbi:MAG: hypothetical protein HQK76_08480 [Desulfobacterales bacterium]|nr:hypothetical protein [Desulfobacterales bacterium]